MLTISLINTAHRHRPNPLRFCLILVVYLLVIHYSVSHTHNPPKDFSSSYHNLLQQLSLNDHADHWHGDQHHSAGCQLTSQAPPSPALFTAERSFFAPFNSAEKTRSFSLETPTKKLTRAPPAFI
ncbi:MULTISPECIES: hypothetical protein [unclassified Endozoicomonas]|uniref:hypothetical protein n=1 Tax=unclassified Endozoicomonas TaxID=2644528 RepID=UPI003BB4BA38